MCHTSVLISTKYDALTVGKQEGNKRHMFVVIDDSPMMGKSRGRWTESEGILLKGTACMTPLLLELSVDSLGDFQP